MQFVWDAEGCVTAIATTVLNPEEDITPLGAYGITDLRVTIFFREIDHVQTVLYSNYAGIPVIVAWDAHRALEDGTQQHAITTMSGCQFSFVCQDVWLLASSSR